MIKHYFYLGAELSIIVAAHESVRVFQWADRLFAESRLGAEKDLRLLWVNAQKSVMQTASPTAYTPYGYDNLSMRRSLLGFNGQARDPSTHCDLLGMGKRAFNPVLMRFCSADEQSPFGIGEGNAYAYCSGDPVNFFDPSGNGKISVFKERLRRDNAVSDASHSIPRSAPKARLDLDKLKVRLSERMVADEDGMKFDRISRGLRMRDNIKDFHAGLKVAVARRARYQLYNEDSQRALLTPDEMALSLLSGTMREEPEWSFLSHEWLARAGYSFATHEELSIKIFNFSEYNASVRQWESRNIGAMSNL